MKELETIDFFGLRLFSDLAASGSFTRTAERLGLTQSAVSRQIQRLEDQLDTPLFERTTRSVRLTEAGRFFLVETNKLTSSWQNSVRELRENFIDGPKKIRFSVSETVAFSYLPGFFAGYQRARPDDQIELTQRPSNEVISEIQAQNRDLGVVTDRGTKFPSDIEVIHQFSDRFVGITPPDSEITEPEILLKSDLIALPSQSVVAGQIAEFIRNQNAVPTIALEAQSFDLIINLVSLGFGCALVPQRALAIYGKRKPVRRIPFSEPFERQLAIIARRDHHRPEHLSQFLELIHF